MRGPSVTLTRTSAALSIVALIAVALSDFLLTGFWDRNAMGEPSRIALRPSPPKPAS
jgi:hypothetical protein